LCLQRQRSLGLASRPACEKSNVSRNLQERDERRRKKKQTGFLGKCRRIPQQKLVIPCCTHEGGQGNLKGTTRKVGERTGYKEASQGEPWGREKPGSKGFSLGAQGTDQFEKRRSKGNAEEGGDREVEKKINLS